MGLSLSRGTIIYVEIGKIFDLIFLFYRSYLCICDLTIIALKI